MKALLNATNAPHAGAWLNVVPSAKLGLKMPPQEFRMCLQYRLGIPLFPSAGPCPSCKRHNDIFGDHAISCASDFERVSHHDRLCAAIAEACHSTGLGPERERRDLFPDNAMRPADIYLKNWV